MDRVKKLWSSLSICLLLLICKIKEMSDKCYFASANTGNGFFNCFESIEEKNGIQYILKGAPGSGKSTIMRKMASRFISMGGQVEYFYCSSDSRSLDGVRLIGTGISIVDGTAPHAIECVFPGLTHKLVDLGKAIQPGLETARGELFSLALKKKDGYVELYGLLSASKDILNHNIIQMPLSDMPVDSLCMPESKGNVRHLFLSSIEKDFSETNSYSSVHFIDANYRSANALFHKAEKIALEKGLSMVCIHNTVNPDCFDALYIPESDILYRAVPVSDPQLDSSIARSVERLAQNRGFHLEIERIYHGFTDYNIINDITLSLLSEVGCKFPDHKL